MDLTAEPSRVQCKRGGSVLLSAGSTGRQSALEQAKTAELGEKLARRSVTISLPAAGSAGARRAGKTR